MENRNPKEDLQAFLYRTCIDDFEFISKQILSMRKLGLNELAGEYGRIYSFWFISMYRARVISADELERFVAFLDPEEYEFIKVLKDVCKNARERKVTL